MQGSSYIEKSTKSIDDLKNQNIPIFCDLPSGREAEKKTIDEMIAILHRDFLEHQLIVASIYKYDNIFSDAKIITMNGTLFNSQTIFDNIQVIIPILTVCNSRRLRTKQD